jgi:hypothetical protein
MSQISKKYLERAEMLIETIKIGTHIISHSKSIDVYEREAHLKFAPEISEMALHPKKGFNNLKSLSYLEDAYMTYWNESTGEATELFWKKLFGKGIKYERKNTFKEVLLRKKIRNEQEYNSIVDGLVACQQVGRITADEALILSGYISDFEKKHRDKGK